MRTGGDFWDDATVVFEEVDLGYDDVGEEGVGNWVVDADSCFVAGRFDS